MSTYKHLKDMDEMSEQELFLYSLKHPGFSEIHTACESFMHNHKNSFVDLIIQTHVNRHRIFEIVLVANNHGILLATKNLFRGYVKKQIPKAMVHIESIPKENDDKTEYTLHYLIEA